MSVRFQLRDLLTSAPTGDVQINSYWASKIIDNNSDIYITLDLIFGDGSRLRMSTQSLTITKNDGSKIGYEPLLQAEPTISKDYDFKSPSSASQRSFSLSVDARRNSALSMIKKGFFIGGVAELALQSESTIYENRFVLMVGEAVGGVSFGADDEPIDIGISDPTLTIDRIIPDVVLTQDRIGTIPDSSEGLRYPLILSPFAAVPCVKLDESEVNPSYLVALGDGLEISSVTVDGKECDSADLDTGYEIEVATDEKGTRFTKLNFAPPVYNAQDQTYSFNWTDSTSVFATVTNTDQTNGSVIDIIRWLIINGTDYSVEGIDDVMFARTTAKAPSFLNASICINGSKGNEVAKAMDYIGSTLIKSFPMMSLAYTGRGVGLIYTDRRAGLSIANLVRGQNLIYDRVSAINESEKSAIYNSFVLQYDYDPVNNNYRKTMELNEKNSSLCSISHSRLGRREKDPIESIVITDDKTAAFVLGWMAGHYSLPSYSVTYEGNPALYFMLQLGDNVRLTDDKLDLSGVSATVEGISYQRGKVELTLRLWMLYDTIGDSA